MRTTGSKQSEPSTYLMAAVSRSGSAARSVPQETGRADS